eukprot:13775520-Alexandrium_andersonii.AAC.1
MAAPVAASAFGATCGIWCGAWSAVATGFRRCSVALACRGRVAVVMRAEAGPRRSSRVSGFGSGAPWFAPASPWR